MILPSHFAVDVSKLLFQFCAGFDLVNLVSNVFANRKFSLVSEGGVVTGQFYLSNFYTPLSYYQNYR